MPTSEQGARDIREFLAVLRRRKLTVLGFAAIVTLTAVAFSLQQAPRYQATTELLLREPDALRGDGGGDRDLEAFVETEMAVMMSRSVVDAVEEELGEDPDVEIRNLPGTSVVQLTASAGSAEGAARAADQYAATYIEVRRDQLIGQLVATSTQVQQKATDVAESLRTLLAPLDELNERIVANAGQPEARIRLEAERSRLEDSIRAQRDSLENLQALYTQQLDELQLSSNLLRTGGSHVISEAEEPQAPSSPRPLRTGALALFAGVLLGGALAFLRERLDDSVSAAADLDIEGLPVLASIPKGRRRHGVEEIVFRNDPGSAAAEAYRSLRASLQFLDVEHQLRVVQVTSARAGEGKSTVAANLAVALALTGRRVILVGCDLRRPRLEEIFGIDVRAGFTSMLVDEGAASRAFRRVTGVPNLWVVPAGPLPPNPAELLGSRRVEDWLRRFRAEADFVVLDSPPVLAVSDAKVLSRLADGVVLVALAGTTTQRDLARSAEAIRRGGANVVGTVLNGVAASEGYDAYRGDDPSPEREDWHAVAAQTDRETPTAKTVLPSGFTLDGLDGLDAEGGEERSRPATETVAEDVDDRERAERDAFARELEEMRGRHREEPAAEQDGAGLREAGPADMNPGRDLESRIRVDLEADPTDVDDPAAEVPRSAGWRDGRDS